MNTSQPLANTLCLAKACTRLGIRHTYYDDNRNLVGVHLGREYIFANAATPLNEESFARICADKEFMHRIIGSAVRTPKTKGFLDPECNPEYREYVKFPTLQDILKNIESEFAYPLIIKMNAGARGINVFKCTDRLEVRRALNAIYDKKSAHYDYIALAQEYIPIKREFRVIILNDAMVLTYEKDFSDATNVGNLSPLHQENSRAVLIKEESLLSRIDDFLQPLWERMRMSFVGLDIALDHEGNFWLIEVDTRPGFRYFVRDNGDEALTEMYEKILRYLQRCETTSS